MKKNTVILSGVILALLFLIWFQSFQCKRENKLQNEAHQKFILEKQRTDSLFTYYKNIQKAQYYFLHDQDSLALDLLKPYGKISDSIQNHIQQIKRFNSLNRVVENSYKPQNKKETNRESNTIDAVLAENIIVKNELALVKYELDELKTPKAMLDLVSSKGVKFQYIGQVKNGNANGFGIGFFESGSIYKGNWKDNMRQGKGVFTWKDGERYEGNYVDDRREGEGSYFWKNGEYYQGQWREDKRNGYGKLYKKSGKIKKEGFWVDDEFKS
ncbi:MORN repeat-containing protein [Flavobacterium tibetense]|uniref:MORN motif-containing protein n=1 Tax=Flavobacterium tibetense TaxID=2233533 RepID=A0A365NZG6_9FLAO|nr:hypothetical protein [Flavobacterium tibetense]RBA27592.1 hypothetical protein DPN68_11490 [Flavobacterium tibetense]